MGQTVLYECIGIVGLPLFGAVIAGLFGKNLGRKNTHRLTVLMVAASFFLSLFLAKQAFIDKAFVMPLDLTWYTWATIADIPIRVGFYLDQLSITMLLVVTFVSWMVHIYTIGYMEEDPGYQRFFSYIAFFTFSMLMLVLSNNFMQLFFGWEAVGVASYLLIGFWYKRETAIFANLKAFLVNRVGDFGFLLGIAGILWLFNSLDYQTVFSHVGTVAASNPTIQVFGLPNLGWSAITVVCILLFIGAMGKSAQVPLHVWLPDSMEGPTPISALIHAATMVTAGIFMVSRMSPLFELSDVALSVVLCIGAITCFFMGLLGVIQNDIKRIIAYSTLSQLGYMTVALGVSAYPVAMFHLVTHAFFKALLFLGAGSVIMAMHHEQDIWKMGGLAKKLPITYVTMFLGSLALMGFPLFSGFYSKDLIIEAVALSHLPGAKMAYYAVLLSVFVTALYSFRLLFVVFHTQPRMDKETESHVHEPAWVVGLPLVLLSIPSVMLGYVLLEPIVMGFFSSSIVVHAPFHPSMAHLQAEYHGPMAMALHGLTSLPVWLSFAGVFTAWVAYVKFPKLPALIQSKVPVVFQILNHKYGFDLFNQYLLAPFVRVVGWVCWKIGDKMLIDGLMVNGSAKVVATTSKFVRHIQSGYIYHYAFAMILGLLALMLLKDHVL